MRVVVVGSSGKMGQEVLRALTEEEDLFGVGVVDRVQRGQALPHFYAVREALQTLKPDAVVDFTSPSCVWEHLLCYLEEGIPAVVGTTGLTEEDIFRLAERAKGKNWSCVIAPNFAIGAILMMRFAKEASRFFPRAEIIEYHHEGKLDAPSGTAIKTAEMMRYTLEDKKEQGGRVYCGVPIHSIRLPGYVAHQEVIFGLQGQTLTLRHDSYHRESFMPGVLLALRRVLEVSGVVYGLESLLF